MESMYGDCSTPCFTMERRTSRINMYTITPQKLHVCTRTSTASGENGLLLVCNELFMAALQRTLSGPQLFQVTCTDGIHLSKNADDGVQLRIEVRNGIHERVCKGGQ